MAVIFTASGDTLSFQRSVRLISPILRWFDPGISQASIYHIVAVARKIAHVSEYALLFLLIYHALRVTLHPGDLTWRWPLATAAFAIAVAYAASDEFHQTFIPSRTGTSRDVLVDSAGAVLALLFLWTFRRWRRGSRTQPRPD